MNTLRANTLTPLLGALLLVTAGCGRTETPATPAISESAVELDVPTEAEADADAATSITPENADAVFEDLGRELDQEELGGDG